MVVNMDGSRVYDATKVLYEQALRLCPDKLKGVSFNQFYMATRFIEGGLPLRTRPIEQVTDGKGNIINQNDVGKLTLEVRAEDDTWIVPVGVVPVDYLNK